MKLEDSVVFVTGTNRGLGRALVDEALIRGARRVYAASREGGSHVDRRVVSLRLDVTDLNQVRAAASAAPDVELLINNAGTQKSLSVLDADPENLQRDLDVNYYGTLNVVRAFVPVLMAKPGAAIVNVLSVVSFASMPVIGGYSASKAAAWSLTQSLRGELREKGIRVHAAFPGPMDTDMARSFDMPKAQPGDVARAIFDGVVNGTDEIAPCAMSADTLATFARDPHEIARRFGS